MEGIVIERERREQARSDRLRAAAAIHLGIIRPQGILGLLAERDLLTLRVKRPPGPCRRTACCSAGVTKAAPWC